MGIGTIPELANGLPHRFEVAQETAMDGLLLHCPPQALADSIGLGLGNQGKTPLAPPELDLFQA
ncbi:hypothetical protein GWK36_10915 [Caldichromatium japonicum]|uniref:Uncharacterized protein n=1 Tax=Caldichromatium japonicum TaxID=2699430 RepID=A0A6G7VEU7_9GAMM|nr:hypothetical protein [Caldichromatium japonicum]QIK38405.1 hypothetical protein GWK36_10915 [Caldichromatium japonicum]